ncbi:MAG: hypothetical protein AAGE80_00220 [Pseudomonadota bacterium]
MIDQLSNDFLMRASLWIFLLGSGVVLLATGLSALPWRTYKVPDKAGRKRASSARYFVVCFGLLLLSPVLHGLSLWIDLVLSNRRWGYSRELDFERAGILVLVFAAVLLIVFILSKLFAKPNEFIVREAELDESTLYWSGWFGRKGSKPISAITDVNDNWYNWSGGDPSIRFDDGTTLKLPPNLLGGVALMETLSNRVQRTRPDGGGADPKQ